MSLIDLNKSRELDLLNFCKSRQVAFFLFQRLILKFPITLKKKIPSLDQSTNIIYANMTPKLTFNQIISNLNGFGNYQKIALAIVSLGNCLNGIGQMLPVLTMEEIDHRCFVVGLDDRDMGLSEKCRWGGW